MKWKTGKSKIIDEAKNFFCEIIKINKLLSTLTKKQNNSYKNEEWRLKEAMTTETT